MPAMCAFVSVYNLSKNSLASFLVGLTVYVIAISIMIVAQIFQKSLNEIKEILETIKER